MANLRVWQHSQTANGTVARQVKMANRISHSLRQLGSELAEEIVTGNIEGTKRAIAEALKEQPKCYSCSRPLKDAQPWAVMVVLELAGQLGAGKVAAVLGDLLDSVGVSNETELAHMVEKGKAMQQIEESVATDLDLALSNAVDVAKSILILQPEKRSSVIAELGGVMPETNGGMHP
jgi:hypothetical protein